MNEIILLLGQAGSGKDYVKEQCFPNYQRFAFADILKKSIQPILEYHIDDRQYKEQKQFFHKEQLINHLTKICEVILSKNQSQKDLNQYEINKRCIEEMNNSNYIYSNSLFSVSPRDLCIIVSNVCKKQNPNIFIELLFKDVNNYLKQNNSNKNIIITDCRFKNELLSFYQLLNQYNLHHKDKLNLKSYLIVAIDEKTKKPILQPRNTDSEFLAESLTKQVFQNDLNHDYLKYMDIPIHIYLNYRKDLIPFDNINYQKKVVF